MMLWLFIYQNCHVVVRGLTYNTMLKHIMVVVGRTEMTFKNSQTEIMTFKNSQMHCYIVYYLIVR